MHTAACNTMRWVVGSVALVIGDAAWSADWGWLRHWYTNQGYWWSTNPLWVWILKNESASGG